VVTNAPTTARPDPRRARGAAPRLAALGEPLGYVDGQNLYEYVGSGPLTATDPMGLEGDPTTQPVDPRLGTIEGKYRAGHYGVGDLDERYSVHPDEGGAIRVSLLPGPGAMGEWWRFQAGGEPCPVRLTVETEDPVHKTIVRDNPLVAKAVAQAVARRDLLAARTHLVGDLYLRGGQEVSEDLDHLQEMMDGIGVVDPSPASDGANALIYLLRGQFKDAGISALAIVPFLGDAGKGGRYAVRFLKKGRKGTRVVQFLARDADEAVAFIRSARQAKRLESMKWMGKVPSLTVGARGFRKHKYLREFLGPAGKGKAWHHIVQQTEENIRRFGAETIHNTANVIALPNLKGQLHVRVSAFYSSIQDFSYPQRVRHWLNTKSFEEQFKFGMEHLKRIAREMSP